MRKSNLLAALAAAIALTCPGCSKKAAENFIVVGSQSVTGQVVAGEIVAQYIEHRLGKKVQRRLSLGTELVAYQEIQTGRISLYPTFTGAIETTILKEQPSTDPSVVWERSRSEMSRLSKLELFNPLGYENPPVMVVLAVDAQKNKAESLSQAAAGSTKWKIGMSYEFQQRIDGVPALSGYRLPMARPLRAMDGADLFEALQHGEFTMITADSIDGRLASPDYRMLADDQHVFPPYQACLLARQDVLAAEPQLRAALAELSGKFTTESIRKMSAQVDTDHREPADVAAEFLKRARLN